jgi:hypothetical protein
MLSLENESWDTDEMITPWTWKKLALRADLSGTSGRTLPAVEGIPNHAQDRGITTYFEWPRSAIMLKIQTFQVMCVIENPKAEDGSGRLELTSVGVRPGRTTQETKSLRARRECKSPVEWNIEARDDGGGRNRSSECECECYIRTAGL